MKLQDYIQYYVGCQCLNTWFPEGHPEYNRGWVLRSYRSIGVNPYGLETEFGEYITSTDSIKLILRKLSDMTNEEEKELETIKGTRIIYRSEPNIEIRYDTPDTFHWMLKKQFDLFELIENGLAIDSKTLK